MKKRFTHKLIFILLAFGAGYWRGLAHVQSGKRVVVENDTGGSKGATIARTQYQPYYTKQNLISDKAK